MKTMYFIGVEVIFDSPWGYSMILVENRQALILKPDRCVACCKNSHNVSIVKEYEEGEFPEMVLERYLPDALGLNQRAGVISLNRIGGDNYFSIFRWQMSVEFFALDGYAYSGVSPRFFWRKHVDYQVKK